MRRQLRRAATHRKHGDEFEDERERQRDNVHSGPDRRLGDRHLLRQCAQIREAKCRGSDSPLVRRWLASAALVPTHNMLKLCLATLVRARVRSTPACRVFTDAKDRFSAVFLRKRGALAPRCRHARRARVECSVDGANDAVVLVLLALP